MGVVKSAKNWIKKNAFSVALAVAGFLFYASARKGLHRDRGAADGVEANNRNAKESAERASQLNSELKSGIERAEQILSEIEATGTVKGN